MLNSLPKFDNIDFKGGSLSSDGGSILLLHFLEKMNITDKLKKIPFNDQRFLPFYSNSEIMSQLITRTILGYHNQSDQTILQEDPLLSKYFIACSQATVSRFFDRVTNQTNVVFRELLIETACKYINQNIPDPIIDADSTLLETYGEQEASAYIHHYSETGYHPLLINELAPGSFFLRYSEPEVPTPQTGSLRNSVLCLLICIIVGRSAFAVTVPSMILI